MVTGGPGTGKSALLGRLAALCDADYRARALADGWDEAADAAAGTVCIAVVAMAEVGRAVRFVNVAFGVWLALAPLLVDGGGRSYAISSILSGIALVALS